MDIYKSIAWELGLPTERSRAALYRVIRAEVTRPRRGAPGIQPDRRPRPPRRHHRLDRQPAGRSVPPLRRRHHPQGSSPVRRAARASPRYPVAALAPAPPPTARRATDHSPVTTIEAPKAPAAHHARGLPVSVISSGSATAASKGGKGSLRALENRDGQAVEELGKQHPGRAATRCLIARGREAPSSAVQGHRFPPRRRPRHHGLSRGGRASFHRDIRHGERRRRISALLPTRLRRLLAQDAVHECERSPPQGVASLA